MEELLKDKIFLEKLQEIGKRLSMPPGDVDRKAKACIKELYTEQSPWIHTLAIQFSQFVLSRAYDSTIDVNPAELKELSKIMRRQSVAFVMTHKTYIDMLVLGVVLVRHGLPLPYIFSGINMSFMGLNEVGRKSGAIFIRRSFKDDEIYKLCLRHFIASLVGAQKHFMWALEGTRSRTGKLVWPKMGVLKYIMEAEQTVKSNVAYIPVSIVYDLIPDVDEMMKEGRGKSKDPESLMWFLNYIRKMGKDHGKVAIRFGKPLNLDEEMQAALPEGAIVNKSSKPQIPKFAFELVHNINKITPVTSTSLICIALLSKFALSKRSTDHVVVSIMNLIESHKSDAMVDRGKAVSQSIQDGINLLLKSGMIRQIGEGVSTRYSIVPEQYLTASYYANMAVHHLYHQAFIEIALFKISKLKSNRIKAFWAEIMKLRDLFKFEFFYSNKLKFTDEIEHDLEFLDPDWFKHLKDPKFDVKGLLKNQNLLVSQVVLSRYLEAYQVVARTLLALEKNRAYNDEQLMRSCLFIGEEMHWKGKIQRVESVSKPFIQNGIRLAKNKDLIPTKKKAKTRAIQAWIKEIKAITLDIKLLNEDLIEQASSMYAPIPIEKNIVPGSKTDSISQSVLEGERGAHIGAFFDLDRTLISGFSAKEFMQTRIKSGKMTPKEIVAQFAGVMVYAVGNKNFAGLAAISAKGVKGVKEKVFIDMGEEVYLKHIADAIYPESRALVEAHMAMGHTVAIISAATPYQANPVARDLGIDEVMCTKMEVKNGKFTGKVVDPPCWGDGKAKAAIELTERKNLDLSKSFFYTDSHEDLPLMEIVGNPIAVNPDNELSSVAFENDWTIYRYNDEPPKGIANLARTFLAFGSMIPAAFAGVGIGSMNMSWKDGVNSMTSIVGDLGCRLAGIKVVIKGRDHLWSARPAVFIFNHQSNVDLLIMAKLLRKDAVGVAKKELLNSPLGPLFKAAGVIFLDRKNREKAIQALGPAVDALKSGISVGIAPEGTRSYDYSLGKFKKGAFHIALQAGVPIVPVIIKNAHDVMPRGSNLIKPNVVEIVVKKPIPTIHWKKDDLNQNIENIRNMYLEELEQEGFVRVKKKKGKKSRKV